MSNNALGTWDATRSVRVDLLVQTNRTTLYIVFILTRFNDLLQHSV